MVGTIWSVRSYFAFDEKKNGFILDWVRWKNIKFPQITSLSIVLFFCDDGMNRTKEPFHLFLSIEVSNKTIDLPLVLGELTIDLIDDGYCKLQRGK